MRLKTGILSRLKWKNIGYAFFIVILLPFLAFFLLRALVAYEIIDDLPSKRELRKISNPLASEIYSDQGKLFGRFYVENRSQLNPEDLNDDYKNALVATEDHRFYKHKGIDHKSLARVLIKSILLQRDASGGGSTISQQLAKNLYPRKRYKALSTVFNKFREMEIAKRLEKVYSKEEILTLYSNTVSFGERAFGLPTASERFFNKSPKDLSLEESATLIGLLKATSYFSPRNHPERAKGRRNVVLSQMEKNGFITTELASLTKAKPLSLDYQAPSDVNELARYFKQQVKKEFTAWSKANPREDGSSYDIYRDGLKIYTSIDYDLQIAGELFMNSHMKQLQKTFNDSWKGGNMFGSNTKIIDEKIVQDSYYKSLIKQGKSPKEALAAFTTKGPRKIWTWGGYETKEITKIDSIKHYLGLLHAGLMAANPKSGAIKAWVGGNDYGQFQYDNILGSRQVGSTFKPIVYLTALENGAEPCKMYENELRTYTNYKDWTPKNADSKYGGLASMKGALTHSINTVSVQVLFEAGVNEVAKMARKLGVNSALNQVPSMVLGTSDVSLYEMVNVYSSFATEGKQTALYSIEKISDADGNVLFDRSRKRKESTRVASENSVRKLNDMLQNVTLNGTGRRVYSTFDINAPIMGKTGTTQNQSDGWFMGFNQELVVGAWVGTKDRRIHFRNLGTGSGGRTALPLAGAIFEYADAKDMLYTPETDIKVHAECADTISHEAYAALQKEHSIEEILNDLPERIIDVILNNQKKKREVPSRPKSGKRKIEKKKRLSDYKKEIQRWETVIEDITRGKKKKRRQ